MKCHNCSRDVAPQAVECLHCGADLRPLAREIARLREDYGLLTDKFVAQQRGLAVCSDHLNACIANHEARIAAMSARIWKVEGLCGARPWAVGDPFKIESKAGVETDEGKTIAACATKGQSLPPIDPFKTDEEIAFDRHVAKGQSLPPVDPLSINGTGKHLDEPIRILLDHRAPGHYSSQWDDARGVWEWLCRQGDVLVGNHADGPIGATLTNKRSGLHAGAEAGSLPEALCRLAMRVAAAEKKS